MKRLICLLLAALLLAGCQPSAGTAGTNPGILDSAQSWDDTGALVEVELDVPGLWKYSTMREFSGKLLLWGMDGHKEGSYTLELCLFDPALNAVAAQAEIGLSGYTEPQILGSTLYLCDCTGGTVLQLDETLEIVHSWDVESVYDTWYMGGDGTLYQFDWNEGALMACGLETGSSRRILEECAWVDLAGTTGQYLRVDAYYDDHQSSFLLDLMDGSLAEQPLEGDFYGIYRCGGTWLCPLERDSSVCYLYSNGLRTRFQVDEANLILLEEGYLLENCWDGQYLRLYGLDGSFVSQCRVTECDSGYVESSTMVWSESLNGYFFRFQSYDGNSRLMFWDLSVSVDGEDLRASDIPDGGLDSLYQRAEQLGQEYGVEIFIGDECSTEFMEFTAQWVEDWETVSAALDTAEDALSAYPDGYFEQLRFYDVQGVQIHLIGELCAMDRADPWGYAALTYAGGENFIVAIDVNASNVETYYHEFSHVTDLFLDWNAQNRDDALYSEDGWMSLNPAGFGYSYDYDWQTDIYGDDQYWMYFLDSYATISPTEDRARVMEYAMSGYGEYSFENPGLYEKLSYYCRCIRDAFDTRLWPETVLWEQYLGS